MANEVGKFKFKLAMYYWSLSNIVYEEHLIKGSVEIIIEIINSKTNVCIPPKKDKSCL